MRLIGLICDLLVRLVNPEWYMKQEEVGQAAGRQRR